METSKLTGAALDWAVAKCEGNTEQSRDATWHPHEFFWDNKWQRRVEAQVFSPSTNWAQGGPIVERERIHLNYHGGFWNADDHKHKTQFDKSPLIAAMRCFVASKLGDEVEIPEELK